MVASVFFAAARVLTYSGDTALTNASAFVFSRHQRLFLVTSRHVLVNPQTQHFPDRVFIEFHTDEKNLTNTGGFSIPLFRNGRPVWRQGQDSAGSIDVAAIEIDRGALPRTAIYSAFTPAHLVDLKHNNVEVGTSLLVIGFPLDFYDTVHTMPVGRQAIVASPFGLRFQGNGYFLTDARTHRGMSGAPVVMRALENVPEGDLPWFLLGIHSARLDMSTRDLKADEALGLNCAWYADILLTLTE